MSRATDLTVDETARARVRMAAMAEEFSSAGILRDRAWREVFERTWRHDYVPAFYPDKDSPPLLCIDATRRGEWLDTVYSDTTLITKLAPVPLSRALRPATGTIYISSSTHPSLVLDMLDRLDVGDGHRVLEIGTGTGYNAALLCERLGSEHVTSIDIDPELVDLAAERLAANGYTPTLETADGRVGHPTDAPYDRIISTCAVPAIPAAWLQQSVPGAVIVTDVHRQLGGTIVRMVVDEQGGASGRFAPCGAGFMAMRAHADDTGLDEQALREHWPWLDLPAIESWTAVDPAPLLGHGLFGFVVGWHLPDVTRGPTLDDDGGPALFLIGPDGSRAEVSTTATRHGYSVRQYGQRRLWDRVEEAAAFWDATGRPSYEQFGLTATPERQYVWFDDPHGPHHWPLPIHEENPA